MLRCQGNDRHGSKSNRPRSGVFHGRGFTPRTARTKHGPHSARRRPHRFESRFAGTSTERVEREDGLQVRGAHREEFAALAEKMDKGFAALSDKISALSERMDARFTTMTAEMNSRFAAAIGENRGELRTNHSIRWEVGALGDSGTEVVDRDGSRHRLARFHDCEVPQLIRLKSKRPLRFRISGAASTGGSGGGGGDMDDLLKRIGALESGVSDIRAQLSAVIAVLPHLATKADLTREIGAPRGEVGAARGEMHSMESH